MKYIRCVLMQECEKVPPPHINTSKKININIYTFLIKQCFVFSSLSRKNISLSPKIAFLDWRREKYVFVKIHILFPQGCKKRIIFLLIFTKYKIWSPGLKKEKRYKEVKTDKDRKERQLTMLLKTRIIRVFKF